ncbi:MAG TPA: PhzF family phenazine biosynthesis protein, partial [Longimicrobiaceae bacterium]|nr:PhzF family phenazine biosynthesis protein [Longimicrobiaceae bacterium]
MALRIIQVDAFTAEPFRGNPAAVCVLPEPREDGWMQAVAREMNLSETAFLLREEDGYGLRWFTPTVEVELCGHATLASAHVLWEDGHLEPGKPVRFHTRSGLLTAERSGDWIWMDFPAAPPHPVEPHPDLLRALGISPVYVGSSRFDTLVEVESEEVLRALEPDLSLLRRVPTRGLIVTAHAEVPE